MTSTAEAHYPVNSWVWVKQPDYPWWPAMVLDPAAAGQEIPDGSDLVLLCGPSAAPTLAFADSTDAEQLRPFRGAGPDAALVEAGRADDGCSAAVAEMIAAVDRDVAAGDGGADTAVGGTAAAETAVTLGDTAALSDKAEKKHKKDKKKEKRKRDKKHKSGSRASRKERASTHHRAHRGDDRDSDGSGSDGDEDDEVEAESSGDGADEASSGDEAPFQRRAGAATASRSAQKRTRRERQSTLEEYDLGPAQPSSYAPRHDPSYYYRKVRDARRTATSAELRTCTQELRGAMARCLSGAASAADVEADILAVLRRLTSVDVSAAQLQETGVGVATGGLLRSFTAPVVQLAQAILTYWFHSLPQNTRQQLSTENELDRCSVETCSDGVAGDNDLGRIGVNLYGCFTNEEINDAPASVDVMALCGTLEDTLERLCDSDAQMLALSVFGDAGETGKALRRLVLEGKVNAEDISRHSSDLPQLVRMRQRRPAKIQLALSSPGNAHHLQDEVGGGGGDSGGIGSPTSPYDIFSPTGDGAVGSPTFGSPTGRTTTALYSCPHCGANDAYRSSYSVQAHDSMPDILRCKQCGQTWNVSEQ
ncbi:PWWP domain/TFIIS helical bundle-like domain containing protein [Novymonas esmeraldas]|uniref:PWWP domain/TFIIS helical bundle-like domain containing protein n=1 Tax=Novymonas esmeraldas TaxID=1808958 RepID=A0AAW0F862_9TRYP